jgi:thymidylate synthase
MVKLRKGREIIMEPVNIYARDLPEAWFNCIRWLLGVNSGVHRYKIDRGSFVGHERIEFDFITIRVKYPGSRPLVPDTPPGIPPPCTQEYLEGYLPYLMTGKFQKNEDYTYGQDLESQIPEVIKIYKEDGFNTNQAFMAVGSKDSIRLKDPLALLGNPVYCLKVNKSGEPCHPLYLPGDSKLIEYKREVKL